jgi:calcineurin-like phosphoesterase family protein
MIVKPIVSKIFLTSDTHFGHTNIIKYCNRPFKNAYLMDNALIENWNSAVGPEDIVYHLGDFAFGGIAKYLPRLNGEIILIRGNHDRNSELKGCDFKIHQNLDFKYGGYKFKMNHRPVYPAGTNDPFRDAEVKSIINLSEYDWILSGHIHEKWVKHGKNINVGVDVWDFKPVSIDTIIDLILNK